MVITLLTDFGDRDTYAAQMKGVLAAMAPRVGVIDLTHNIQPQNILEAAVQLDAAVDAFEDDTVHIAVVDPGVGTARRGIAARCPRGTLVGPDNGIFTAVLDRYPMSKAVSLEDEAYLRTPVSPTFHGRDVFAPAAAHLATGLHLTELGPYIDDLVRLDLPRPLVSHDGGFIKAHVLLADRFGNLVTDLRKEAFDTWLGRGQAQWAYVQIDGRGPLPPESLTVAETFADVEPGRPVAYFGSSDRLEIAVRDGDAADTLKLTHGDAVSVMMR